MGSVVTYSFENIIAWQKAHEFVLLTYRVTRHFPEDEKFGLTSQFRRAAVSIEANIAEGYKKLSKADKLRFFNIAQGSLEECRDYHILSRDLGYLDSTEFEDLHQSIEETSKFLNSYMIEKIYPGKILMEGLPRNSIFFDGEKREKTKAELKLKNHQIFAYMPTYREKNSTEPETKLMEILSRLDKELKENQILFLKLHPKDGRKVKFSKLKHIKPFP